MRNGWRGSRERPQEVGSEPVQRLGERAEQALPGAGVVRPARSSRRSPRTPAPAPPPCRRRTGGRAGAAGWIQRRPCALEGRLGMNGAPTASGWIAEQTSWTKPGSVSSAERAPPPTVSPASKSSTEPAGPREHDRGGEPVGPRAHDDRVTAPCHGPPGSAVAGERRRPLRWRPRESPSPATVSAQTTSGRRAPPAGAGRGSAGPSAPSLVEVLTSYSPALGPLEVLAVDLDLRVRSRRAALIPLAKARKLPRVLPTSLATRRRIRLAGLEVRVGPLAEVRVLLGELAVQLVLERGQGLEAAGWGR